MKWDEWHVPLSRDDLALRTALDSLDAVGARQQDIPLSVRLLENPKYSLPGMTLFHGAVDLAVHDRIHLLLGRGLLTEDEAFTIGFTMGSTKHVSRTEEWLFGWLASHVYPPPYTFDANAVRIFNDAVRLGGISGCLPLNQIDYDRCLDMPLGEIREQVGLETDLLVACYRIEKERYPESVACQRLLD
jgi:hypothetical protein